MRLMDENNACARSLAAASLRKTIFSGAVLLFALIGAYLVVMALTLTLSSDAAITANLTESIILGALEPAADWRPSPFGHEGHRYDRFSECVGLSENLNNGNSVSLLYRIAAAPYVAAKGTQAAGIATSAPCDDLIDAIVSHAAAETPYSRFWHGYQIYTRIALSFFNLYQIHILNATILYGCLLYTFSKLRDWFGWRAAGLFIVPTFVFSDILSAPFVTVHALPLAFSYFCIARTFSILETKRDAGKRLPLFSFAGGSLYNFISMLFTPQFAPAFMAFAVIAAALRGAEDVERRWRGASSAILVAAAWFLGFSLTWAAKWLLAACVLGLDSVVAPLLTAMKGVNYHSFGMLNNEYPEYKYAPALLLVIGQEELESAACAIIVAVGAIIVKFKTADARRRAGSDWLLLQAPLLIVLGWTELMRYHSVEHATFAGRAVLLFIVFPLLGLFFVLRERPATRAETPERPPKAILEPQAPAL